MVPFVNVGISQTSVDTEAVKKMIVFIYAANGKDERGFDKVDESKPMGTGFLIVVLPREAHWS